MHLALILKYFICPVPKLLVDLHVKLLRKIGKSVSADRWEKNLIKVSQSVLTMKTYALNDLCHMWLYATHFAFNNQIQTAVNYGLFQ